MKLSKRIFGMILILFVSISMFGQNVGEIIKITVITNLYTESSILSKSVELLPGEKIKIIKPVNIDGYYFVESKRGNGFVNSSMIVMNIKMANPEYRRITKKTQAERKIVDALDQITQYESLYGEPDHISSEGSFGHSTKTYVWNCYEGKQITIEFIERRHKNGYTYFVANSQHASNCPVGLNKEPATVKETTGNASNTIKIITTKSGLIEVPIILNDVLRINFIFDSGASEVSISPDVALTLMRTGTISESDWLPSQTYTFADGSRARSKRFLIKKLIIGTQILTNIEASISNSIEAPMLIGQNVMQKLGSVTIDYNNNLLIIKPK